MGIIPLGADDDLCRCQNCSWQGPRADAHPINDITQRVDPGEPMPSGECPKCGALCQPIEEVLTEQMFLDAGYKTYPNQCRAIHCYSRLLQRKMPKGYFIDIQVYDHVHPVKRTAFQPHAQMHRQEGTGIVSFNVDLFVKDQTTVLDIETFFDALFDSMECIAPE